MRATPRRIALLVSLGLVGLASWHYYALYRGLADAQDGLLGARAAVESAGFDADAADLTAANARLAKAEAGLARADRHYSWDPLIQGARVLPFAGRQADAVGTFTKWATLTGIGTRLRSSANSR